MSSPRILAPRGVICESCYSDSREFKDHITAHPDSTELAPGFSYVAPMNAAAAIGSCEDCGEPFEERPSEGDRIELEMERVIDSDPDDIDRGGF